MKKKLKKVVEAALYSIDNPNISATKVSELYKVDRHILSETRKNIDTYKNNWIDGNDGYLYYFDIKEKELIDYFIAHPDVSIAEAQRIVGINIKRDTLKHWLKIVGYDYYLRTKYHNNKNAFESIKTEEDAYWLGFFTADGYVDEKNNKISLNLGIIDEQHLRKFLEYLQFSQEEANQLITYQYGGAYNKDNLICRATICGKQIVENLRKLGVRQAKSGKEVPYICENSELEIAYIRGLLDGDGYIRTTQYGVGIVGSEIMMEYIRDFFAKHLNWEQTQDKYIHPHGKIYKFCVGGKDVSKKILHLLYDNATIYLNRKYKLYELYCRV